jgi:Icc-related predicted phosphoesterase
MNIAVFADTHGRVALAFELVARWQQATGEHIDLILQAGDLGAFPNLERLDKATLKHAKRDPTELDFAKHFTAIRPGVRTMLEQTDCPMIFVRGNHEDHAWLDELESQAEGPTFSIDPYNRVHCLKTGVPWSFSSGGQTIRVLGVGRISTVAGQPASTKAKFIQPHELERLNKYEGEFDVLLTHDSARDFVTPGFGMPALRELLDQHQPAYHLHGHTGESCRVCLDSNGVTQSIKLTDLEWDAQRGNTLSAGSMGILRWNPPEHQFEVVNASWLLEYNLGRWKHFS